MSNENEYWILKDERNGYIFTLIIITFFPLMYIIYPFEESDVSNYFYDFFSMIHIIMGIVFYFLSERYYIFRKKKVRKGIVMLICLTIAILWEVLENSILSSYKYRGNIDSPSNIIFDIIFVLIGSYFLYYIEDNWGRIRITLYFGSYYLIFKLASSPENVDLVRTIAGILILFSLIIESYLWKKNITLRMKNRLG